MSNRAGPVWTGARSGRGMGPVGLILSTAGAVPGGAWTTRGATGVLDVLLGNRAAQVSVEVYQRMLAGDRDEVHDQAGLC